MQAAAQSSETELAGMVRQLLARLDNAPSNHDLWDTGDIASYVRLSKKTVQNHVVNKPGFPRPIILPTGGTRWVASEIKTWALRQR